MFDSYMGLEGQTGQPVHVWTIPYEGTASFAKGTRNGPQAMLQASCEIETWDHELQADLADHAHFITHCLSDLPVAGPQAVHERHLRELQARCDPKSSLVLTLGGEHSVALAPITFYREAFPDLVVIQIDAHADLRPSYQDSPLSHASVMARVMEMGLPLVQLGIRSLCREEARIIAESKADDLLTLFAWDLGSPRQAAERVRSFIGQRPVYVSFDVDGLDPSIMPGTGTPEPGGLSFAWLQSFWTDVFRDIRLVGLDCCEVAPLPGCGVVSESVAVKCVNRILLASFLSSSGQRAGSAAG